MGMSKKRRKSYSITSRMFNIDTRNEATSIKCLGKQGWVKKGRLVANGLVPCKSVVSRRLRATTTIGHEVVMSGKEVTWQTSTSHAFSWILLIQLFGSNYWIPTFVDGECAYVFGHFVDVLHGNIVGWNLGRDMLPISSRKGGQHRFNPRCGELGIGIHKFLDVGTTIFGNARNLINDAHKSP